MIDENSKSPNGVHGKRFEVHIFVDGEPYEVRQDDITPNQIIVEFGRTDPTTHYLVEIGPHGKKRSFEGKGAAPIEIHNGEKFQIISTGPTPVSDDNMRFGTEAFIAGLRGLGYQPTSIPQKPDHVMIEYDVPTGRFAGRKVRLGFIVPADFPATTPSGPHVSPHIHPVHPDGQHPTGAIHHQQAVPFQEAFGGEWQYWSRPCSEWGTRRKSAAVYMAHIWRLWDTQ